MRRNSAAVLLSAILIAAPASVKAVQADGDKARPSYSLSDLGTPDRGPSYASAINDRGQVAAYSLGGFLHHSQAFVVTDGVMVALERGGNETGIAHGINEQGVVVGWADISFQGPGAAAVWDGDLTFLTPASGPPPFRGTTIHSNAYDINDYGQVVGEYMQLFGDFPNKWFAVLFEGGQVINLGAGAGSVARAINNRGEIAGTTSTGAFLYRDGVLFDLGPGSALAINDKGYVAGTSGGHAVVWAHGKMDDFGEGIAYGINSRRDVVGTSNSRGVLWDKHGNMSDLTTVLDATGAGWLIEAATAINKAGQIAGWGIAPDGQTRAVLLTPNGRR